jgi:Family of unknown function (DUF6152)
MRRAVPICWVVLGVWAMCSVPVSAHHGYAAYDMTKTVEVKGTVTGLYIVNPHSWIAFDTKDEQGKVQHWIAEAGPVRLMRELGWTLGTVKAGDEITVYFHPAKNGSHSTDLVKIELADGRVFVGHSINGVNEK